MLRQLSDAFATVASVPVALSTPAGFSSLSLGADMPHDPSEPLDQVYRTGRPSPLTLNRRPVTMTRRNLLTYTAGATSAVLLGGSIPELATPARAQLAEIFVEIAVDVFVDVIKWFLATLIERAIERSWEPKEGGPPPWSGERGADFHNIFKAKYAFPENFVPPTKSKPEYGQFVSIDSYYRADVDPQIHVNRDCNGVELKRVKHYFEQRRPIVVPYGERARPGAKAQDLWHAFLRARGNEKLAGELKDGDGKLTHVRYFQTPSAVPLVDQKTYIGCGINYRNAKGDPASQIFLVEA